MSSNSGNWAINDGKTAFTRVSEVTNGSFEDVAIDSGEDIENARLLENQPSPVTTTSTSSNGNTGSTSINIEFDNEDSATVINNRNPQRTNNGGQFIRQQFYTLLNEARTHFVHPSTSSATVREIVNPPQQNEIINENSNTNRAQSSDWRRNLDNLLSMSILPNAYNFQFTTNNLTNNNLPPSNLTASHPL